MPTLGILESQTTERELFDTFQNDTYEIAFIDKKEQLAQVEGVVLTLTKKEEFSPLIDWLLACKKTPSVFVWVFSTINLDSEQDILMKLGTNGIVIHETQLPRLSLLVKNTFLRLEHISLIEKTPVEHTLLNPKNQSIWINQIEQVLTRKEYQLLDILYENRGTCILYETLVTELWSNSKNQEIYNLTNIIFHLRKKIKDSEELVIKTVRSKGYVLLTKDT